MSSPWTTSLTAELDSLISAERSSTEGYFLALQQQLGRASKVLLNQVMKFQWVMMTIVTENISISLLKKGLNFPRIQTQYGRLISYVSDDNGYLTQVIYDTNWYLVHYYTPTGSHIVLVPHE